MIKEVETFELNQVKHTILVASGKGGVGKSTVAAHLALSLAQKGFRIGLLDADIHGPSVPTLFGLESERPLSEEINGETRIVPFEKCGLRIMSLGFFFKPEQAVLWRGPMVTKALKQMMTETNWGDLDYLIVDTPPGTGDVHITLVQQFHVDGVVIVTTPQKMALADVQKAMSMFREPHINIPILAVVENMSWFTPEKHQDERYYLFGQGGGAELCKHFGVSNLIQIPTNEQLCRDSDEGNTEKALENASLRRSFEELIKTLPK